MTIFNLQFNLARRRNLRRNMTKAEVLLWQRLKNKQLGYKFRRQHGIGSYIVDFYCPSLKLVIEVDGCVHALYQVQKKDKIKETYLTQLGLKVVHYLNRQVFEDLNSVIQDIYNTCLKLTTPYSSLVMRGYLDSLESHPKIRGRLQRGLI